jgi:hypothetical protein
VAEEVLPRRFYVQFTGYSDRPASYTVCSWQGELKAVAVAAAYHATSHPRTPILEVAVEPLGTSSRQTPEDGDLADATEWR